MAESSCSPRHQDVEDVEEAIQKVTPKVVWEGFFADFFGYGRFFLRILMGFNGILMGF